ncbi:hypothetical protein D3C81_1212720 [compost metagenome]
MGDQHQGGAAFLVQFEQQIADALTGVAVEVAGRLVGEQYCRFGGKGSGNGDPLLFTPGQLAWRMTQALAQAHPLKQVAGMLAGIAAAVQLQRQHDVFQGIEAVEQLERLEHETDMLSAYPGALVFVQGAEVMPGQGHRACTGQVETGEQAQQGRLT